MKVQNLLIIFIAMTAVFIGNAFAGSNINTGLWEITTDTEMIGMSDMPKMNVPSQTHRQCLSKEDLVPQSKEASQECKIINVSESGDTISWKIICSGKNGSMEGTGEVTYSGDSLEGSMNMEIKGTDMKIRNKIKGHRIGECTLQ